jgi:hypothetical protein
MFKALKTRNRCRSGARQEDVMIFPIEAGLGAPFVGMAVAPSNFPRERHP